MMLIDRYLPDSDFREVHHIDIAAAPSAILAAAMAYRPDSDPVFRAAIALREYPAKIANLVSGARTAPRPPFGMSNFTLLDVAEGQEAVFGLAGRFWRLDYGQVAIADAAAFLRFDAAGAAKLALNHAVEPLDGKRARLITETRIYCIDAQARRHFTPYWYMIRLVSGLIRRRMLSSIKRDMALSQGRSASPDIIGRT